MSDKPASLCAKCGCPQSKHHSTKQCLTLADRPDIESYCSGCGAEDCWHFTGYAPAPAPAPPAVLTDESRISNLIASLRMAHDNNATLFKENAVLRAEVERLTRERDNHRDEWRAQREKRIAAEAELVALRHAMATSDLAAAEARAARLEAALREIAENNDYAEYHSLCIARAALDGGPR